MSLDISSLRVEFETAASACDKYRDVVDEPQFSMCAHIDTLVSSHFAVLLTPDNQLLAIAGLDVWQMTPDVDLNVFEVARDHRGQRKGLVKILAQGIFDFVKSQKGEGSVLRVEHFSNAGKARLKPVLQQLEFLPENSAVSLFIPPEL